MKYEVPIWEKYCLTLDEAAAYFGIGINKLREMTDDSTCTFVVFNGTKRLIKRKKLEEYKALGIDKLMFTTELYNPEKKTSGPAAHSGIYLNISHDTRIIEKRNI